MSVSAMGGSSTGNTISAQWYLKVGARDVPYTAQVTQTGATLSGFLQDKNGKKFYFTDGKVSYTGSQISFYFIEGESKWSGKIEKISDSDYKIVNGTVSHLGTGKFQAEFSGKIVLNSMGAKSNHNGNKTLRAYLDVISMVTAKINNDPYNDELYSQRCVFLKARKMYNKALNDCNRAISLSADSANFEIRGNLFYDQKMYDKAIVDYNKALQPLQLVNYCNHNDPNESKEQCILVIKAEIYGQLGRAYKGKKDCKRAKINYAKACKLFKSLGISDSETCSPTCP